MEEKETRDMDTPEEEKPAENERLCYHMRLTIGTAADSRQDEIFFGPGIYYLLGQINKYGSILTATKEMKMAYSRSWKIIRNVEKNLGFRVLERHAGRGSDSKLTPKGEEFIKAYHAFLEEVNRTARESFDKYFSRFSKEKEER